MNPLTLYLEGIVLASAVYPSGFSYSLFTNWKGVPRETSTGFLWILAAPYPVIVLGVSLVRPELVPWHSTTMLFLAAAVLLVPVTFLVEYGIHSFASYLVNGRLPRRIAVQSFWRRRLSPTDHLLLGTVAAGEEIIYRGIWVSILLSLGLPAPAAAGVSSLAYGINHMAFGGTSVISKTVTGLLYCTLYLSGGRSIWLPIVSHVLQNILLFVVAKEPNA